MAQVMKWYEGEYYRIYTLGGIPDAIASDKEEMTLEECRTLIDKRNAYVQGNAAAYEDGCRLEQYLIVKHIFNRCYTPDGVFIESNMKNRVVEIYPAYL